MQIILNYGGHTCILWGQGIRIRKCDDWELSLNDDEDAKIEC